MQEIDVRYHALATSGAEYALAYVRFVAAHGRYVVASRRMSGSDANSEREVSDEQLVVAETKLAEAGMAFAQEVVPMMLAGKCYGPARMFCLDEQGRLVSNRRTDLDNPHRWPIYSAELGYANPLAPDPEDWLILLSEASAMMVELKATITS